jgi:hypothetical protein
MCTEIHDRRKYLQLIVLRIVVQCRADVLRKLCTMRDDDMTLEVEGVSHDLS